MKVEKETLIKDNVNLWPEVIEILMNFGMTCFLLSFYSVQGEENV